MFSMIGGFRGHLIFTPAFFLIISKITKFISHKIVYGFCFRIKPMEPIEKGCD